MSIREIGTLAQKSIITYANQSLMTFVSVSQFSVYLLLLAQFLGESSVKRINRKQNM